ncbi:MAG: LPS export ABC transporter permease LptG [Gammaproteobacteria bacterium]
MILSAYIRKTVVTTILLIVLILMGIELLIVFIGELSNIGTGNYGILAALHYVVFDMPYQLNILFPMACLVGSLLGLGVLATQSELVVMRAAGYSTWQISYAVLQAACIIMLVALILGEVIAPYAENLATTKRAIAKNAGQALNVVQGLWIRDNNNFIFVEKVVTKQYMQGITAYTFDENQNLQKELRAEEGFYKDKHWFLKNIRLSELRNNKVFSSQIPAMVWQVPLEPSVLDVADADPRNMSLLTLQAYIHYLRHNGLSVAGFELSFWKRLFQPLASLVMILLAVPFIFGPLRSVTMGLRLLAGIAVGFFFYILNQFFGPISLLYQISPDLGAALPTIIFALIGIISLSRIR